MRKTINLWACSMWWEVSGVPFAILHILHLLIVKLNFKLLLWPCSPVLLGGRLHAVIVLTWGRGLTNDPLAAACTEETSINVLLQFLFKLFVLRWSSYTLNVTLWLQRKNKTIENLGVQPWHQWHIIVAELCKASLTNTNAFSNSQKPSAATIEQGSLIGAVLLQ